MRLLRQLLGLDPRTRYATVSGPVTVLVFVLALAAFMLATRVGGLPELAGIPVISVVVAAGFWLATKGNREAQ
jgi:hypothetical protein